MQAFLAQLLIAAIVSTIRRLDSVIGGGAPQGKGKHKETLPNETHHSHHQALQTRRCP